MELNTRLNFCSHHRSLGEAAALAVTPSVSDIRNLGSVDPSFTILELFALSHVSRGEGIYKTMHGILGAELRSGIHRFCQPSSVVLA